MTKILPFEAYCIRCDRPIDTSQEDSWVRRCHMGSGGEVHVGFHASCYLDDALTGLFLAGEHLTEYQLDVIGMLTKEWSLIRRKRRSLAPHLSVNLLLTTLPGLPDGHFELEMRPAVEAMPLKRARPV